MHRAARLGAFDPRSKAGGDALDQIEPTHGACARLRFEAQGKGTRSPQRQQLSSVAGSSPTDSEASATLEEEGGGERAHVPKSRPGQPHTLTQSRLGDPPDHHHHHRQPPLTTTMEAGGEGDEAAAAGVVVVESAAPSAPAAEAEAKTAGQEEEEQQEERARQQLANEPARLKAAVVRVCEFMWPFHHAARLGVPSDPIPSPSPSPSSSWTAAGGRSAAAKP